MRLHTLEVTAFGPFADTVTVDFDQLSAAGLFLLSGPTGAGKTSVLDAVCFALYGDVPGDRATAKRLRSDQAAPGVAPRVVLETSIGGRRFRIARSPAWERPKKRGTGLTNEQASVSIAERVDGSWVTLSTRLDETGDLVGRLVGMTLTQFTQVAMLPQGRFQAFLRARSEDRQRLLQQLFRTGRFEAVERWLRERRLTLRRQYDAAHRSIADVTSRISEAASAVLPEDWTVHDLALPAGDGALSSWSAALGEAAAAQLSSAAERAGAAAVAETQARTALEEARARAERRARLLAASVEQQELLGAAPAIGDLGVRLDAARRAATVTPVHRIAARAETALATAQERAARALGGLGLEAREAIATSLDTTLAAAADVRRLRPRAGRLDQVRAEITALDADRSRIASEVVRRRRHAEAEVAALTAQLGTARVVHLEAQRETVALRSHALDVRQARLEGMAAEIAGQLAVGSSCPVCGSHDHPHKASRPSDAPDEAAERAADKAATDAAATEHLRDVEARDLQTRLDRAVERAEQPVDPDLAARTAQVEAALESRRAEADALDAEVRAALEGTTAATLDDLLSHHEQRERVLRAALVALDDLAAAATAADDARTALADAATDAGFDDADDASDAALPAAEIAGLAERIADHEQRLAAVTAILADADPGELEQPALFDHDSPDDLEGLARTHTEALESLGAARSARDRWTTQVDRLGSLHADLEVAIDCWRPLRDELDLTAGLAAFVEGKSPDNRLQMRLSAYVLAFRLSQVVAAANERLARMSDQRYSLEHTARRGAGETRGGLSLLVRDDWTGESRDPATLSGGETFVVSLALALGLADVITQESAAADSGQGTQLETLFVDEGFGSLDADTLDDVMDTLDSLREGGRVVGVVSHVAEMRDRIPAQLVVRKSPRGSTVAVLVSEQ